MTLPKSNLLRPATLAAAVAATFAAVVVAQAETASPITRLNPDTMPPTLQYGYSQVTTVTPGAHMVYVAGQVGQSETGPNDFKSQVDRAFDHLAAGLTAAGAGPQDVVQITLLIVDHEPEKLAYLVEKRKAFFGAAAPASVLIPVTELYTANVSFEISAIAALPAGQ